MKYTALVFLLTLFVTSCQPEKELTVAEKIANAHGFKNWDNVSEVNFTFRVNRDTIIGKGRSWTWQPQTGKVSMTANGKTTTYNQRNLTATNKPIDRAFINDKFWLLIPFQLVWDTTATISEVSQKEAPISKTKMDRITITYPNQGGYTPGDAYDIYFDKDFIIREWTFRKGNSKTPTLSTTFENHKDFNGIKIATDHKKDDGKWNLNFTDISVTLN